MSEIKRYGYSPEKEEIIESDNGQYVKLFDYRTLEGRFSELEQENLEITQTYNAFTLELNNIRGLIVPTLEAKISELEFENKALIEKAKLLWEV